MIVDNFVHLPPLSTWPRIPVLEPIDKFSEIFYLDRLWKSIVAADLQLLVDGADKTSPFHVCKAILEYNPNTTFVAGYNPLAFDDEVLLCPTTQSANELLDTLRKLQQQYKRRVPLAKVRASRPWISLGSEQEVDEAGVQWTRDRISIEWIGCLEKRQTKVGQFVDVDSVDVPDAYSKFAVGDEGRFLYSRKMRLDVDMQADIKLKDGSTQTDIFQQTEVDRTSINSSADQVDTNVRASTNVENNEKSDNTSAVVVDASIDSDEYLNYFESFVNTENRRKMIASVAWHPTRLGFVAIAYVDDTTTKWDEDAFCGEHDDSQKHLVPEEEDDIDDADIKVNEAIFDYTSRKRGSSQSADSDDNSLSFSENEGESDDEMLAGLSSEFKVPDLMIYRADSKSNEKPATEGDERPLAREQASDENEQWISEILTMERHIAYSMCRKQTERREVGT